MKRIIYCSQAADDFSVEELVALLTQARANNERLGLTGMLLYCNKSFLQVIEGDAEPLEGIYARIREDPRHTNVRLLMDADVDGPLFDDWTMGFEHVDALELAESVGFTSALDYMLINPDVITSAVVAQKLLTRYANNGPQ